MLIFTGGEPTFCPQFDDLIARARKTDCYVAVETNGVRWREGLRLADWISVSPKDRVAQTSTARWHNPSPGTAQLDHNVREELAQRVRTQDHRSEGGEYRYVISRNDSTPHYNPAHRHYVSPAVLSSGRGDEWKTGFPGYSRGAVERCLEIVRSDPRWRISTQIHKLLGVR